MVKATKWAYVYLNFSMCQERGAPLLRGGALPYGAANLLRGGTLPYGAANLLRGGAPTHSHHSTLGIV
jgi:hypothetical protein